MSTTLTPPEPAAPSALPAVETPPPAAVIAAEEPPYQRRLFTAAEFWRMHDIGLFGRDRLQLIGGEILLMAPPSNPHALGVDFVYEAIVAAFGPGFWVRNQGGLDLSPMSIAIPDIAVVTGDKRTYVGKKANPKTALLVVEVSLTTLAEDRGLKASLYASAGISDYWILNLQDNVLEVRRGPRPDATQPLGHGYSSLTTLSAGESESPLAAPEARVAVADLLPA